MPARPADIQHLYPDFTLKNLGPVVQSIVSSTSSLVVKMLSVLVSILSNSHVLLLKKMLVALANAKAALIFFFSKNISLYAILKDQSFSVTLTNDIVSFEQLITKTCLYNFDPLKPHCYMVKLGFRGVYIIFLISAQKHRLWVLVRTALSRRF